ncbi:4988_t:CDS:2 [Diversispora eburnea]|uniref:4988_t:CDS:1 n=1 Tax=Diversispora eburnea TaxID=1213867 RepID=A0A9N9FIG5_9GLOM|nr:4988_t:CDS:2 [Diversispora eburnea]
MRRQGTLYLEQSLNANPHTAITSPGQKSNDETPTSVITRCMGCENTETDIRKKETTLIQKSQDSTFKTELKN